MLSPIFGNTTLKVDGQNQTEIVSKHKHELTPSSPHRFFFSTYSFSFLRLHLADIFDFLLTRTLTSGHILDFNPYAPRTDPLLFTYDELHTLALSSTPNSRATFRVIDSRSHPAATRNAPMHQHNMIPIEALTMSSGVSIEEFARSWQDEVRRSARGNEGEGEGGGEDEEG